MSQARIVQANHPLLGMPVERTDYDSPWKEILETYFKEFMAFFFPVAHGEIDWGKGCEFLDKELQQIVREAEVGKRLVDKLVKVWTTFGDEIWVLIHIEVQSQYESGFEQRMFTYHTRIHDLYNRPVASFAILADENPNCRPSSYQSDLWGSRTSFQFAAVKLLDYRQNWDRIEASDNPFSTVVMAHLKTLETKDDVIERQRWKLSLAKRLYQQGYDRQSVINLLRFIDWLVYLPKVLEEDFWNSLMTYQEEQKMQYVMSIERFAEERGIKKGIEQGVKKGIEQERRTLIFRLLNRKFGTLSDEIRVRIQGLSMNQLEKLGEALLDFDGLVDLEDWFERGGQQG